MGYPKDPRTLGEHLRRRRIDLGLTQRAVAQQLVVDPWTILNWERGKTRPGARHLARLTGFLGYFPFPGAITLPERILETRQRLGLTQRGLAVLLGVAECTVADWEHGRRRPRGRRLLALKACIDEGPAGNA
ncbi:MAG TPA: helix-turn-helix domain-containing protein [Longimicrobiales bacterium]|nr:helix-turn-helix domain-containing protein [Longimicrobiales bacterium]